MIVRDTIWRKIYIQSTQIDALRRDKRYNLSKLQHKPSGVVATNDQLIHVTYLDGAILSSNNSLRNYYKHFTINLVVNVTIKQLLIYINIANKLKALGHANMFSSKSFFKMFDDKLRFILKLVRLQVLLRCHVTMAVCVGVLMSMAIRHINKQVPLVVVWSEPALCLLNCKHLKSNNNLCGHRYFN